MGLINIRRFSRRQGRNNNNVNGQDDDELTLTPISQIPTSQIPTMSKKEPAAMEILVPSTTTGSTSCSWKQTASALKITTQQQSLQSIYPSQHKQQQQTSKDGSVATSTYSVATGILSMGYNSLSRYLTWSTPGAVAKGCDDEDEETTELCSVSENDDVLSEVSVGTSKENNTPATVRFHQVQSHLFSHELSNQLISTGAPVCLGSWIATFSTSVDQYEKQRKRQQAHNTLSKRRQRGSCALRIPALEREEMLLQAGVSRRDIKRRERAIRAELSRIEAEAAREDSNDDKGDNKSRYRQRRDDID